MGHLASGSLNTHSSYKLPHCGKAKCPHASGHDTSSLDLRSELSQQPREAFSWQISGISGPGFRELITAVWAMGVSGPTCFWGGWVNRNICGLTKPKATHL